MLLAVALGVSTTYVYHLWNVKFEEFSRGSGSLCDSAATFQNFNASDGEKVEVVFAYFYETQEEANNCFEANISAPAEVVPEDQTQGDGYEGTGVRRVVTRHMGRVDGRYATVYSIVRLDKDQLTVISSLSLRHAQVFEEQSDYRNR